MSVYFSGARRSKYLRRQPISRTKLEVRVKELKNVKTVGKDGQSS